MNLHAHAEIFLEKLFAKIEATHITIDRHWDIDHLCFRTADAKDYETTKSEFARIGNLLIESEVNGRLIATYKLHKPVWFRQWKIDLIEVPAPKAGKLTVRGFEHIEVVVDVSLKSLQEKYQHLNLDLGGLKKSLNRELEIVLGEHNIKFHNLSLESVIRLESNLEIFQAIESSKVLVKLQEFDPLVLGTFPLGLQNAESDIDISVNVNDLKAFQNQMIREFRSYPEFHIWQGDVDSQDACSVSFLHQEKRFEVFAQAKESIMQNSAIHFFAEEKILKYASAKKTELILKLRQAGKKTEPAFAEALMIKDQDAYEVMLKLAKLPLKILQTGPLDC